MGRVSWASLGNTICLIYRVQGPRIKAASALSQGAHTAQTLPSDPVRTFLVKLSPGPISDLLPEVILGPPPTVGTHKLLGLLCIFLPNNEGNKSKHPTHASALKTQLEGQPSRWGNMETKPTGKARGSDHGLRDGGWSGGLGLGPQSEGLNLGVEQPPQSRWSK